MTAAPDVTTTAPAGAAELALASFQAGTRHHTLAILRDDGLYRHLRFRHDTAECAAAVARGEKACKAVGSAYWFDITAWPGNLAVTGDMGSWLFGRAADEDMLAFFRGQRVNPAYWSEKVKAADVDSGIRRYSEALFLQHVAEYVAEREADFPGLTAAVQAALTDDCNPEWEATAHQFLNDFEYRACPDDEAAPVFRFTDTWEWRLTDFAFHYLWACHAVTWGIARYDEAKAAAPAATTEGGQS